MLPPEELRSQNFTKVLRGYSPEEVEQHIEFIIEKYSEIYVQNELLKRKLNNVTAQYNRLKSNEEAIKATMLNAQTASSKLINETCERAEHMMKNTKENCNKILTEYKNKVEYQQYILSKLDEQINEFRSSLFNKYRNHIQIIEDINTKALTNDEWMISEEVFVDRIMRDVIAKDKEFDENAEIAADPEINSEENKKKIEDAVQQMIEEENEAIAARKTEEEEKKRLEEESLRLLKESRPDADADVDADADEKEGSFKEENISSLVVSEFDYDNDGEYELYDNSENEDAEIIEEVSKIVIPEDDADVDVTSDILVNNEDPEELEGMISELNRIFGAENEEVSSEKIISEDEYDEIDDEIVRLLNDIVGTSDDNDSK